MNKDNFYKDSFILTLSNLTTGIFGFMFSIILSEELGPEGMGLYGLVMPVYNLFICLISGGMVTALSRVCSIYFIKHDNVNLHKSIKVSLIFDFIWSLIIAVFVFGSSRLIGTYFIKDARTVYAIQVTCPAMICIALTSILKGYFYGVSNIKVPALIDIFEKFVRIIILICVIKLFALQSTESKVTASYIALTIGEFTSLLLLYTYYIKNRRSTHFFRSKSEDMMQLLFDILVISFPLCLNGFLSTALSTASTLIVPRRLVSAGIDYNTALSLIGKFTGMSMTIVYFPLIVVTSISTILIPDLSQNISKKDYWSARKRISEVIKISLFLGISTLIIIITLSDSLGGMFFRRNDLGEYIKFAALSAPVTYSSVATFGIMNGLGKQKLILKNSLIVSVEELVLLYILIAIPSINIFGYGITQIITSTTLFILNIQEIRKISDIDFHLSEIVIFILVNILYYFILQTLKAAIPNSLIITKNVIIIACGFTSLLAGLFLINLGNRK